MPVVLLLHGAGGNSRTVMRQTGLAGQADERGFLVVAADGTPPRPELPPQFLANPQVWNDGSARGHAYERGVDDSRFLSTVLDEVAAKHRVDGRHVYVMGFSNGGSMAFRLAAERPERVTAIAAIAGHPFAVPREGARPVPAMCVGGTSDPLTPLTGGSIVIPWGGSLRQPPYVESIGWWAQAQGCAGAPATDVVGQGVRRTTWSDPRREGGAGCGVVLYVVEGAGHIWPGGTSNLPEMIVGTDPGTFDATSAALDFLFAHAL